MVTPGYGTAERSVVREYGARFRELAEVAAELAAAETVVEVVALVTSRVRDVVGAATAVVMLREDDDLNVVADVGLTNRERWRRFSVSLRTPASEAARRNRPREQSARPLPARAGAATV